MELRLFVFHHTGGSHPARPERPCRFPAARDVRPPGAPGRGLRSGRPALGGARPRVSWSRTGPEAELSGPSALFGHGGGGLIACGPARALLAGGRPPVWLGPSARGVPRSGDGGTRRHPLSGAGPRPEPAPAGGTPVEIPPTARIAAAVRAALAPPAPAMPR
ncbi:hypothetical protein [Streptomyces sp. NPDC058735]|uniref:hypothetical protein n=1 Tax=unclassified Streptomyces TaxID=2593676 RepID=UPI0036937BE1